MNNKHKNKTIYTKKLVSYCDDELFMSGEIIISWNQKAEDPSEDLRICRIDFDLQRGRTAILRVEEVEELIAISSKMIINKK